MSRPLPVPGVMYRIPGLSAILRMLEKPLSSYFVVCVILLLAELALTVLIIRKVPYTEIDWKAYMDEVRPVLNHGERNYSKLRGETGPLVYPGAFVWMYAVLFNATAGGSDVAAAQYIFAGLYLFMQLLVFAIYRKAGPPSLHPVFLGLLCLSKRVHSIFVLRLFNDGPTMLLLYLAVLLFLHRKWGIGCVVFSLAVGVKMNVLLYAPGLLLLLLVHTGLYRTIGYLSICAAVQVLVGLPFLLHDPVVYLLSSFNFGRVFKQHWSVNFRWVPCDPLPPEEATLLRDCEGIFTSRAFGGALLATHVVLLLYICGSWARRAGGLFNPRRILTPQQDAAILFTVNFVGVALARSLHFQFYVWYFHTLPFLLWLTDLAVPLKVAAFFLIEAAWNPWVGESSTVESSLLLTALHALVLYKLLQFTARATTTS